MSVINWFFLSFGGMTGSLGGAFFTEYLNPWLAFAFASIFSLLMVIFAFRISNESDKNGGLGIDYEQGLS